MKLFCGLVDLWVHWVDFIQIIYGYSKYAKLIPGFLRLLQTVYQNPHLLNWSHLMITLKICWHPCFNNRLLVVLYVCTRQQLEPGVDGVGGILPHCQATMAGNERYWRFMNMKKSICTRMWHNHRTIDGPHSSRGDWWLPALVVMWLSTTHFISIQ